MLREDRPRSLYDECSALVISRDLEDPLSAIRAKLKLVAFLLAKKRGEDPRAWSVYVERHIAGVRFILHDASGREVDLQRLPAEPQGGNFDDPRPIPPDSKRDAHHRHRRA